MSRFYGSVCTRSVTVVRQSIFFTAAQLNYITCVIAAVDGTCLSI